jgi:hypothetical protein
MAFANRSRAFSRLLPAYGSRVDLCAVLGPLFDLVEIAIVREERIVGFHVRPNVIHARCNIDRAHFGPFFCKRALAFRCRKIARE